MEQKQGTTLTQQVGSMLPSIHEMACFTQFCACKVKNLSEYQKETFNRISNRLAAIFSDINILYGEMSEDERCAISPFDDPINREEVSSHD